MAKSFGAESIGADGFAVRGPISAAPQRGCALIESGGNQLGWTARPALVAPLNAALNSTDYLSPNGWTPVPTVSSLAITTALGYTPANDANVIHTSGNETKTGNFTVTGNITSNSDLLSLDAASASVSNFSQITHRGNFIVGGDVSSTAVRPVLSFYQGGATYGRIDVTSAGAFRFYTGSGGTTQASISAGAATFSGKVSIPNQIEFTNTYPIQLQANNSSGSVAHLEITSGGQTILALGVGPTHKLKFSRHAANSSMITWGGDNSNTRNATQDAGIYSPSAGTVEINNGTAGTLRDLKVRNLYSVSGYPGIQTSLITRDPGGNLDIGDTGGVTSISGSVLSLSGPHGVSVGLGTAALSYPFSVTQTWKAADVTFTAAAVNVTDTASASGSYLLRLQTGGVDKVTFDKTGAATFSGNMAFSGSTPRINFTSSGLDTFIQHTAANTIQIGVNNSGRFQIGTAGVRLLDTGGDFGWSDGRLVWNSAGSISHQAYYATGTTWQTVWTSGNSASGAMIGVLGASAAARQTLPAAATDATTTQALCNAMRAALITFGFCN